MAYSYCVSVIWPDDGQRWLRRKFNQSIDDALEFRDQMHKDEPTAICILTDGATGFTITHDERIYHHHTTPGNSSLLPKRY